MNTKTIKTLAILSCLTVSQLLHPAAGRDIITYVVTICTGYIVGGCTVSNITINAVGDKQSINTSGLTPKDFGTITESKRADLNIPVAGKKLFAFTPTQGPSAYKQVRALFYTLDISKRDASGNIIFPAGAPANMKADATKLLKEHPKSAGMAKTMFCVYRQGPGETQWTQFYLTVTNSTRADLEKAQAIKMTVQPNGWIRVFLPSSKELQNDGTTKTIVPKQLIVDLGKKSV